jgi:hypothetical protein
VSLSSSEVQRGHLRVPRSHEDLTRRSRGADDFCGPTADAPVR